MPDPIYKTKDGQRVTKSQLLNSGYSEDRITKGLDNGILSLIGDTETPTQAFKTSDGQLVTTEQLLTSGYSQERIDNGVANGILAPSETLKKNGTSLISGIGSANGTKPISAPQSNSAIGNEPLYVKSAAQLKIEADQSKSLNAPAGIISPFATQQDRINIAIDAFNGKRVKPEDIDILQNTSFGQQNGLYNLTTPKQKEQFASSYNSPKVSDNISAIQDIVEKYPFAATKEGSESAQKVIRAFNAGDVNELIAYRGALIDNLKKQIIYPQGVGGVKGVYGEVKSLTADEETKNKNIESEIAHITQTFADYVDVANSKKAIDDPLYFSDNNIKKIGEDAEKMQLGNNSFAQRQLLTSVENKKYQQAIEEIDKTNILPEIKTQLKEKLNVNYLATENVNYDREKSGLSSVLNTLGMEYHDLRAKALTTNPELSEEADKKLDQYNLYLEKFEALEDKYPDVRVAKTARFIGDEIAKRNLSMIPISATTIRAIAKDNPEWYAKYGSDIDYLVQHPQMIPKSGFLGGIKSGLYDIGEQISTGFGFGGESDIEKAAREQEKLTKPGIKGTGFTEPTRIVFDKQDKAYKELPNEDYGKINWNNSMRFLGKSAPGLAEFILLDKGLGAAAKLVNIAGVEGLLGMSQAAAKLKGVEITAEEIIAAKKALSLGENAQKSLGLFGALYVSGHEQSRKIADDLIDDNSSMGEAKKTILANLLNLSSFAAFKMVGMSPSSVFEKVLQKSLATDAVGLFEKNGWKITQEQTENFFKNAVIPKLQAIAKTTGQSIAGGVKLGAAMVLDENTRGLLGTLVNPDKAHIPSLKDDIGILTNQVLLMTAAGLPGLVSAGFTPTTKDVLYDAGLKYPQQLSRIDKMLELGEIDDKKANELKSMVNTIGEEVYNVQNLTNDAGLPLTVKQKRDIAVENFRKRAAEQLKTNGLDINSEGIASEADKTIKIIQADNRFQSADNDPLVQIMNGTEPAKVELTPQENKVIDLIKSNTALSEAPEGSMGRTLYESAKDPANHSQIIKELVDQSIDPAALSLNVGKDVSDAILELPQKSGQKTTAEIVAEPVKEFRTDEQVDKILEDSKTLSVSERRLPRDIPDVVRPNKSKMSVQELRERATRLRDLVNCLS